MRSKRGKLESILGNFFARDRNVENSNRYWKIFLHAIETWKTRFDIGIFLFARNRNVNNSIFLFARDRRKTRLNVEIFLFAPDRNVENSNQYWKIFICTQSKREKLDIFICTRSKRGKLESILENFFVRDRNVENSIKY